MDHRSVLFAAGLPLSFQPFFVDGETQTGLPRKRGAVPGTGAYNRGSTEPTLRTLSGVGAAHPPVR